MSMVPARSIPFAAPRLAKPLASHTGEASSGPVFVKPADMPADAKLLAERIEGRLSQALDVAPLHAPRLVAAMRHATLSPGKRIRPLLTLLAARQCGADAFSALDVACAVEMVHCASLVLDDLPCMDDAALRRGRPATHRLHGEDIAILAAIGLLNQAFHIVAISPTIPDAARANILVELSSAIGPHGLIAGQEIDLRERAAVTDIAGATLCNRLKTGVLIEAAVEIGALAAQAGESSRTALRAFARCLGDAFQLMDDVMDSLSSAEAMGKDAGQDSGRMTVVAMLGAKGARAEVRRRLDHGCEALAAASCGAEPLAGFARAVFADLARPKGGPADGRPREAQDMSPAQELSP